MPRAAAKKAVASSQQAPPTRNGRTQGTAVKPNPGQAIKTVTTAYVAARPGPARSFAELAATATYTGYASASLNCREIEVVIRDRLAWDSE